MALNVIFLLSSIVTARLLEKKKMRIASVAYSVMFIIMAIVLLFTVDNEVIRKMMVHLFGKECYFNVHITFLDAIRTPLYGAYIIGAILLTVVIQFALTVFCATKAIVYHFFQHNSFFRKSQKVCGSLLRCARSLYLSQDINLLCCRMLN